MKKKLKTLARILRKNPTEAERKLWHYLRKENFHGLKFRRQHRIGNYIVDFVCLKEKIVIELDGGQHYDSARDRQRDGWLEEEGYRVLRIWNHELMGNMEGVLGGIEKFCLSPSPWSPPLKGGESFSPNASEPEPRVSKGANR